MFLNQPYRSPAGSSMGPTPPPPIGSTTPVYATLVDSTVLPSISNMLPQNQAWNIMPCTSTTTMELGAPISGLSSLLNLDNNEIKQLNSEELASLNCFDTQNLSENLSANLSLVEDANMTDSLTRLANNTIDRIYQN